MKDRPRSLADKIAIDERHKLINESHVKPLTEFVNSVQKRKRSDNRIPYIDPFDGGVNARVLFVQKTPGGGAILSSFVSRDNNDDSAECMYELSQEAELERTDTILWNIVPWTVSEKISTSMLKDGSDLLNQMFSLLPQLKVVVFQGEEARKALNQNFVNVPNEVKVLESILPSWNLTAFNRRDEVLKVFKQAKRLML